MYKPGTQLIMVEPWSREAAIKLGFLVEPYNTRGVTDWRITVTESGPNAAERFLPQVFDVVMLGENDAMRSIGEIDDGTYYSPCGDFWPLSEVKRIIERNGIPFPQFSEVIEP